MTGPTARIALLALSALSVILSGCGGDGSQSQPPPQNPEYLDCVSTTPVNAGNPNQPVISLIGPRVINQSMGTAYVDQGATASDPNDGDITGQIQVTGLSELNTNVVGDYQIRYNVSDSAKLSAVEVVRIVRVTDGTFAPQSARDMGTTSAHMAYYEHLPVHYGDDPSQKFPLILYQHGAGGARFTDDGSILKTPLSGLELGDMVRLIHDGLWDDSRPFIVLSPQRCVDPIIYFVTAGRTKLFLDYAVNTYNVDTSRIYIAGYSAGSSLTWDYVNNYPQQIAAVVPMSGSWGTESGCTLKLTPAWAFQAADDPVGPPQNQVDTVNSINACNPVERAKITVFPTGGHNVQEEFMTINLTGLGQGLPQHDIYDENIYEWLLRHRRPSKAVMMGSNTFLAVLLLGVLLSAACGGGGNNGANPPQDPLASYTECMSVTPVDSGNPNQPVTTLVGPRVINHPIGTNYVDQGATANDPHDGEITSQIQVTGLTDLNTNVVGDYLIRYSVSNGAKLPAVEVVRIVRVNNGTFAEQTARDIGTTGTHMGYYEHLPAHYSDDPNQRFPLLIFQHGWYNARFLDPFTVQAPLSILEQNNLTEFIHNGQWDDSRPFIVLSPQKCVDALTFVVSANRTKLFIDYAINSYQVDTSRIYMAGHSQGSGDTWDYVANYPQQLAAIVPLSGGYGTASGCTLKQTPAWAFNGEDDDVVAYHNQVDTVNSINACNPVERAKVTVLPGVHHNDIQEPVFNLTGLGQGMPQYDLYDQSIYDWLLQHSRP